MMPNGTRRSRRVRQMFALSIAFAACGAMATSILHLRFDQIRDRAGLVVLGTVASTSAGTSFKGMLAVDEYRVVVRETMRGERVKNVRIRIPRIEGAPRLHVGTAYVFFLGAAPARPLVSPQQGILSMESVDVGGNRTTLLVSGDSEPLVLGNDGALRFGAPVSIRNHRIMRTPQTPSVDVGPPDVPTGAEGVSQFPAPASAAVKKPTVRRYATLDDLRGFVRNTPDGRRTR